MQRILDIIISSFALLIHSPVLLFIAILLSFTGEGEVLFCQQRIGKYGKSFNLFKFATMLKNSPNIGSGTVTIKDDIRILPLGRFLRRTKINELPQLVNILLGSMSLVGPRAQAQNNFNAYPLSVQKMIIQVNPGLTGIGSIIFRSEEHMLDNYKDTVGFYDNVIVPYKGQIEMWYIKNQSLSMYFMIIIITIWVIVFSSSQIAWRVFRDIPLPPDELKKPLNFPNITQPNDPSSN